MSRFMQMECFNHELGPLTETLIEPVFLSMDSFFKFSDDPQTLR